MYILERTRGKGSKTYLVEAHNNWVFSPFRHEALEFGKEAAEAICEAYPHPIKMVPSSPKLPRPVKPKARARKK